MPALRVITWNIAEGSWLGYEQFDNSQLALIAHRIRQQNADLVFLNEALLWNWPFGKGVHQVRELMRMATFPHAHWGHTNRLGWASHKAVAVLSRWPLGPASVHPVSEGYAILRTSIDLGGVTHHLYSLRFDAWSNSAQRAGLSRLRLLVKGDPPGDPIIAAGDFNCGDAQSWFVDFAQKSGLRNTRAERRDDQPCPCDQGIDHIFFRGRYEVLRTEIRCPDPHPSDHVWVLAELGGAARPSPQPVGGSEEWEGPSEPWLPEPPPLR